jgi:hypothetical protein
MENKCCENCFPTKIMIGENEWQYISKPSCINDSCPCHTPPSTTRSDAEVQRIKSLYRGVVNLDVEPNRYEFPNYEAADKAIDELIRRIAAQERQAGRDDEWESQRNKFWNIKLWAAERLYRAVNPESKMCVPNEVHAYVDKQIARLPSDKLLKESDIKRDDTLATARSPKDGETRV